MAKPRAIVVETWDGPVVVKSLGRADPDPTPEELAQLASAWVAFAGGLTPSVRVIERAPSLRSSGVGGAGGAAGSLPRR
jgi:hypothetical protein